MNRLWILGPVAAAVLVSGCDQTPKAKESAKPTVAAAPPVGRFQIVINTSARADTFLLDTVSGKVWQLTRYTDVKGDPTAWGYMSKLDNSADFIPFINENGGLKAAKDGTATATTP